MERRRSQHLSFTAAGVAMRPRATRLVPLCVAVLLLSQFDAALACSTKEQGYRTEMWSDLHSLVTAEAEFHEQYGHYTADLDSLDFRASTGVNPPSIQIVGETGWRARNTHSQTTMLGFFCTIAIGEAVQPNETAGESHCAYLNPPSRFSAALTGLAKQIFLPSTFLGIAALVVLIRSRTWAQRSRKFAAVKPVALSMAVASVVLMCLYLAVGATGGTIGGACDWVTQPTAIFLPLFCGAIAFVFLGVRFAFRRVRGTGANA
jgi:hypothetical protein